MISPLMIGICIFYIAPFFQNMFYSFTNLSSFGQYSWTGLKNYKRLFLEDENFFRALGNTAFFTLTTVPLTIITSIIMAVLLNTEIKGLGAYRTLFFLPAVTMPAAVAMVWKWLYNGQFGLLNHILAIFGIEGQNWISDPQYAMGSIVIMEIWRMAGYYMIILLAGLQNISKSLYQAAEIDGAGPLRKLFCITLPLLTPSIFFVGILAMISSFQVFVPIIMMIGDRSMAIDSTMSVVYLFFREAFLMSERGYAAALSVILFLIIMAVTAIQMKLQKKWVYY